MNILRSRCVNVESYLNKQIIKFKTGSVEKWTLVRRAVPSSLVRTGVSILTDECLLLHSVLKKYIIYTYILKVPKNNKNVCFMIFIK